jgi:hypothetical protein
MQNDPPKRWTARQFRGALVARGEKVVFDGPDHMWVVAAQPVPSFDDCQGKECAICMEDLLTEEEVEDLFVNHIAVGTVARTVCGHVRARARVRAAGGRARLRGRGREGNRLRRRHARGARPPRARSPRDRAHTWCARARTCAQLFHADCLSKWLKNATLGKEKCPLCRTRVMSETVIVSDEEE